MTPNKPIIAQQVANLMDLPAYARARDVELILIAKLADVITHNAGQMNKLVDRVTALEQQVILLTPKETEPTPVTDTIDFAECELKLASIIMLMGMPMTALGAQPTKH